ncbi:TonB-dependent copper receptor [Kosakonia sp. BYX6]|uniref:TonB-dependent copper receptor n=1 Tax=Kosakonia calanthes TaxID=3139408 RepID=A0ABZ3BCR3_9ENTR
MIPAARSALPHDSVMIVTTPVSSPLEVVTSPKRSHQPLSASDGAQYLQTLPGFSQIRNGGTNGDPLFRGMFGSRLRILTNNGEILGACGGRMDSPTSYLAPENFDLLTLIKGPETVLWGPGNSAGTVRFDREPPRFNKPGVQGIASMLAASNQRLDKTADLSLGSETGYLRLTGNTSRAGDYKAGNGERVPSKWQKWNGDMALGWTPDKETLFELTAGKGDGEARYAGRGMDGSQFKRESVGAQVEKSHIGDVFDKFEANIYSNYADHIMDNFSLRSPPMKPMAKRVDRRTTGARVMGTWLWSAVELRSGTDAQRNTHRRLHHHRWVKDARFDDAGLFSELTWHATEQSHVISGARFDRVKVTHFASQRKATLPAGFTRLEHHLADIPVMMYAGIGYTERFPDYWELFSPRRGFDINSVKTEKTTQLDIGAHYAGARLNSWVSAYIGRINDYILFRYDSAPAKTRQVDNIDATIMGGEAGVSYALTENWKSEASVAYSWGKNDDEHRALAQIPPLEAHLGLTWTRGNWSSSGLLRLVSSQHRVAINEGNVVGKDFAASAGFAVLSANAAYNVNEHVNISAGVDNLFNKTYSEHLNLAGNGSFGYSANTPIDEPGRTWWGKLSVTF